MVSTIWLAIVLMSVFVPGMPWGPTYTLACLVAGVLLGPPASSVVAAASTVALWALHHWLPAPLLPGSAMNSVISVWLCTAVIWAVMGHLYRAVLQAEASAQWAWSQVREARLRRGELSSVVHSLEEATFRIDRLNHELNQARLEAEVARSLKARFVATVSHEIRGPLNLILGFSRLMVLSPEHYGQALPPAYRADMDAVYRNSEHLAALIDDVIDLSQIEAERLPLVKEWVDLNKDVLTEAMSIVRPLAERKGLALRKEVGGSLPTLFADPVRLRQVLLNLLVNAVRFTQEGGITVAAAVREGVIQVSVQDTGAGIAEEDIPKLFKEFSQVHPSMLQADKGSGLGLSISKYLVELHGGNIWVESRQGLGTTVHFTLPLLEEEVVRSYRLAERTMPAADAQNLLVVHDDPYIVRLLARYLEGYRVVGTADEGQVCDLVDELHPCAVITTPGVGERLAALLCAAPDVPLITCGLARSEEGRRLEGLLGYLVKPITPEMLFAVMRRVPARDRMQVLLVDDDPDAVRLLERLLTSLPRPYQILKAYDGEQALALMRDTVPDVVLMDLVMPHLDGQSAIERMRADERLRDVPVITVSARDMVEGTVTVGAPLSVSRREPVEIGQATQCLKAMIDAIRPSYVPPVAPAEPSARGSDGQSAYAAPGRPLMPAPAPAG